jgi:hypothetical protein
MITAKAKKLQYLLITELMKEGSVELILPDGITLEIGIIQEDQFGNKAKADDYCYVVATREGKTTLLDSYNLGIQFESQDDTIVFEDEMVDEKGHTVKSLDVL